MNKLQTLFFITIIGLISAGIAVIAFTGPGSNTPPAGTPAFWQVSGSNVYYSGGNVGIGTTTPQTALDVNGTISVSALYGSGGVGVPKIEKQYVAGTAYTNGTPTVSGTYFTLDRGVLIPYQTTDGAWRLKFNIVGVFSGAPSNNVFTITISGITSKNVSNYWQAIAGADYSVSNYPGSSAAYSITPNSNQIVTVMSTVRDYNTYRWSLSGDIELNSKPTWAD